MFWVLLVAFATILWKWECKQIKTKVKSKVKISWNLPSIVDEQGFVLRELNNWIKELICVIVVSSFPLKRQSSTSFGQQDIQFDFDTELVKATEKLPKKKKTVWMIFLKCWKG